MDAKAKTPETNASAAAQSGKSAARNVRLRSSGASLERLASNAILVRSDEPLGPYPKVLTDRLLHWAKVAPERTCVAKREAGGDWRRLSYADVASAIAGIGQALMEQVVYDPESGQLLTGSLMDYCVPRADQFPPMVDAFEEGVPGKTNLLGGKGCGELGTIGAAPAVVNAVLDALAERGVLHLEMPLTPERVWRALHAGR